MQFAAFIFGAFEPAALLLALPDVARAIGAMVLVVGMMVLVHEWGHFIVARSFNVRVDIFSIGFGPRLTGWRRGPTDYRISALPIGGYVKMAGDSPDEDRSGAPDEFLSKPRWQRALIIAAGPAMNVVSAGVLFFMIFYHYGILQPAYLEKPAVLAGVLRDSPAAKAGLQAGDRLVEVNHARTATWEDVEKAFEAGERKDRVELVYDRAGQRTAAAPQGDATKRDTVRPFALIGYPDDPVELELANVVSGQSADRAGMKLEDRILSVDGTPVLSLEQFLESVQDSGGRTIQFAVRRSGQTITIPVQPFQESQADGRKVWHIGVQVLPSPTEFSYHRLSLGQSVAEAGEHTYVLTASIFGIVRQLISGGASLRDVAGPVGIARYSGQAAKRGLYALVFLTAGISLNLAVLNLLPIPILDGGHILLLCLEGIRRRDFSQVFRERFLQVGLVFLLLIFVTVMYNDIRKLIPAKWLG
ncbi:MAG TPA: RIP metalloprotease RseP [Candidatus Acidoferrales bacterium]|nr:RIP metalloprotease RseP [Candidatus Acidoferrales bacterium]